MKFKDTQLDFEALLAEAVFGHGFAHYGYWPEGPPETPSAEALGRAQQAYFDKLAATIPEGIETILDVGSGTGANARALRAMGYRLECLCPSEQLNAMARAKLGEGTPVHDVTFEAFDSPKRFDMCLFAESFHYIALAPALAQAARYAQSHVLIFDYFRRDGGSGDETRGTHRAFVDEVAHQGVFEIVQDDDLTEAILPTFLVLDHLKNAHFGPFLARLRADLRTAYPLRSRLAEVFLGRAMDRFLRPSRREQTFAARHEYRLILLRRS
ncbi:MAG: class I SAM-dependent methyltransferase [Rhodobacteraceae bacterium]|nr:class I SAM-dependent methyltransferase [Paracoccaceae bacterium]